MVLEFHYGVVPFQFWEDFQASNFEIETHNGNYDEHHVVLKNYGDLLSRFMQVLLFEFFGLSVQFPVNFVTLQMRRTCPSSSNIILIFLS